MSGPPPPHRQQPRGPPGPGGPHHPPPHGGHHPPPHGGHHHPPPPPGGGEFPGDGHEGTHLLPEHAEAERRVKDRLLAQAPRGEWVTGMCSCMENVGPSCWCSFACPCVVNGQIDQVLSPEPAESNNACVQSCLISGILQIARAGVIGFILDGIILGVTRGNFRDRFAIPGSRRKDCCLSTFCPYCVLAQMSRHLYSFQDRCEGFTLGPLGVNDATRDRLLADGVDATK